MSARPTLDSKPTHGSEADRGTGLGGATRALTGLFTSVLRVFVFIRWLKFERLRRALGRLWRAAEWAFDIGIYALRIIFSIAILVLGGVSLALTVTERSSVPGRLFLIGLGIALLATAVPRRTLARWMTIVSRRPLRVAALAKAKLAVGGRMLLALADRSALWHSLLLLAASTAMLACIALLAALAPSVRSGSYPVFALLILGCCLALLGLLLALLWPLLRLLWPALRILLMGVFFPFALPVFLLMGLSKLAQRAAAPLAPWLDRAAERGQLAGQRMAHSLLLSSRKAAFQATRGQLAPFAPMGEQALLATCSNGSGLAFQADVYHNEFLPRAGTEVHAIVTVTAGSGERFVIDSSQGLVDGASGSVDGTRPSAPEAAEVILLDCSGSMAYPLKKLREAQRATAAAIDSLRDGTWFALVRATERAELAYPLTGGLAQASPETRRAAKRAVRLMWPEGGTAMGQWLTLARDLLASRPTAIAHAILLTDGSNESESHDALEAALAECEGRFQCDCRGVGTDWRVKELRMIASRLLGSVDIVAEPADLESDFRSMIEQAMSKATGDVSLRLWTPRGASVAFLKQVAPTIENLTDRANPVDALTVDYPTGAWGDESRDYHLCVRVPAKEIGDELLAARVSMVVAGRVASQALVRAIWTDDEQLSTRINREVAHYTGQAELADAIQEGLEARKQGDEHTATFKLGRAVQLADAAGNSDTMKLLEGVVDVQDPATGTVRLKRRVQDADEMALDTRSTKTVRVQGLGA